jgi:hypothetical protein
MLKASLRSAFRMRYLLSCHPITDRVVARGTTQRRVDAFG